MRFEGVQKNMLKAWDFTKNKSATGTLMIICQNFSEQTFLKQQRTDSFDICFNGPLMT